MVCVRTSSSVNSFFSLIALTIVPLQTPLQPQISVSSLMRGDRVLAAVTAVAEIGCAEHQPVAHSRHVGAVAQKLEVPRAVDGVAIEHGADDLLVVQDDRCL